MKNFNKKDYYEKKLLLVLLFARVFNILMPCRKVGDVRKQIA